MLSGLNHITVTVSDIQRSLDYYIDKLGFTGHVKWDTGAYLSLSDMWFCLSLGRPSPAQDYSHIAFSVPAERFQALAESLSEAGITQWQPNSSEGDSLYILDPDGHRLELHVGTLQSRLAHLKAKPYRGLQWL